MLVCNETSRFRFSTVMKTDRFSICSGVLNRIRLACGQYKIRIAGFFSVTIPLGYLGILPLSWPSKMKSVGTFGHQVQPATISKILFRILKIQNRIAHSSFS